MPEQDETPLDALLKELESYARHNAVLPSDHLGEGRVVSLSKLRGWIARQRTRPAPVVALSQDDGYPMFLVRRLQAACDCEECDVCAAAQMIQSLLDAYDALSSPVEADLKCAAPTSGRSTEPQ